MFESTIGYSTTHSPRRLMSQSISFKEIQLLIQKSDFVQQNLLQFEALFRPFLL